MTTGEVIRYACYSVMTMVCLALSLWRTFEGNFQEATLCMVWVIWCQMNITEMERKG